ncbi:MAG: hypothetical protein WCO21_02430 [bacterium]|nr:hypothetical protein [Candidatus Jorgensenbacteria bacterium]
MDKQKKVSLVIFIIAISIFALMILGAKMGSKPSVPKSTFKGPIGVPFVKGPTGPPPQ